MFKREASVLGAPAALNPNCSQLVNTARFKLCESCRWILEYSACLSGAQKDALRKGCLQLSEHDDGRNEVGAMAAQLYRAITPVF